MTAFLLGEALLQCLHDLVPRSERLDLGHLFGGQVEFGDLAQPLLGDCLGGIAEVGEDALEHPSEDPVETVELALVVDENRPRQIVELLGFLRDHLGVHRFEQQQMLLEAGGNPAAPKRVDEIDEHEPRSMPARAW